MKNSILSIFILLIASTFSSFGQSDLCATATPLDLSSGNQCVNGTTVGATSSLTLYGGCNTAPVNEVWYTYVSNGASNTWDITPGTLTDVELVIYTVGCGGTLELCDTETGSTPLSSTWGIPAGTQVWIGVMSNGGTEGTFELCVTSVDPPPTGGNTCGTAIPLCDVNATTTVDMAPIGPSGTWPSCFLGAVNADVWFTLL
jgi:hypothetical protein